MEYFAFLYPYNKGRKRKLRGINKKIEKEKKSVEKTRNHDSYNTLCLL